METKKNVLIVTDGTEPVQEMAKRIAAELEESRVVSLKAADFFGTEILPADVYFFGCEDADPPSFAYLSSLLGHINLVGRPCGIFSPKSKKAITYLSGMVRDSELALNPEPFFADDSADLSHWVKDVVTKKA